MCTGAEPALMYAAMAATAAGTAAQISATRKTRKATEEAAYRELANKEKTNKESQAIFDAEATNSDPGKAAADSDAEAIAQLQAAQGLNQREDTGFTGTLESNQALANASPVVKEAAAADLAQELQRAEGQMKARATLSGMKQRFVDRGYQFGRAADQMAMLGNFNQGWGQVGQLQTAMAQHAGDNQAMLGDALVGLGSMGLQYGAAQSALGAGKAAGGAAGTGLTATGSLEQPLSAGATTGLKAPAGWGNPNTGYGTYALVR